MVLMALLDAVLLDCSPPPPPPNCFFSLFQCFLLIFYLNEIIVLLFFLFPYSSLHYSMHVCILQFTPLAPYLLVQYFFLPHICVYFSNWAPLSISSLSEESSSYEAAGISLQESKMNYCQTIFFFSWRPKGGDEARFLQFILGAAP